MKFAPVVVVALMATGVLAGSAFAQGAVVSTGGNITCTPSTGSDDASTSVSTSWSSFDFHTLYLASIHGWMVGSSVQTPARIGLPSARAVRFASAGRPGARVTRVTCP